MSESNFADSSFISPFATRISGTGTSVPKKSYSNAELVADLAKNNIETSDEWIQERTGIGARFISERGNELETNSAIGYQASIRAMEMAGKKAEDIDLILYATCSPETLIPATACYLQDKLGAKNAWAFDLNAACSGFVYAASIADQYIRTGTHKTVLVVGAEVLSSFVDWTDRSTCILFGDAAGAAIFEQTPADSPRKILSTHMGSDGSLWELLTMRGGGSREPVTAETIKDNPVKIQMNGREIFKEATRTLCQYAKIALEKNNMSVNDLDWYIPHQANARIIDAVGKRLKLPKEKTLLNIERFGNTSSATVPTVLDEYVRNGTIKEGQTVMLDVFGAGLTYGSVLMKW